MPLPVSPYASQQAPTTEDVNPETGLPFTQEELAALLGTYGDQLELGALESQQAQADALRNQAGPEGRSSGRVYTAANPLEELGHIGQMYAGKRMNDRIQRKGAKLRGRIGEGVRQYGLGALGKKPTPPPMPPGSVPVPKVPGDELYGL